ncbi:MAG: TRAP transporter substrate-binding protein [Betaproteobacteria bacterium]
MESDRRVPDLKRRAAIKTVAAGTFGLGIGLFNSRPLRAAKSVPVRIASDFSPVPGLVPHVHKEFMDLLTEFSKGEFDPKFFGSSTLGNQLETLQKVQLGTIEVANFSTSNLSAYVPFYAALDFPYVTGGESGGLAAIENALKITRAKAFAEVADKTAQEKGFRVGFLTPVGVRNVGFRKGFRNEVRVPEQIKGAKIRVTGSPVERKIFEVLGVAGSNVPWTETPPAVQTGVIDAIHNGAIAIVAFNFHPILGSVTATNFFPELNLYVASQKWYAGLPPHLQAAFTSATNAAGEIQLAELRKSHERAVATIRQAGAAYVEPSASDYAKWYDLVNYKKEFWEPLIKNAVGDTETFRRIMGKTV